MKKAEFLDLNMIISDIFKAGDGALKGTLKAADNVLKETAKTADGAVRGAAKMAGDISSLPFSILHDITKHKR